jgi:hypothetical protein
MSPDWHTYRVCLTDGLSDAHEIEFEALGSDIALLRAQKLCGSRSFAMFEDGKELANLQCLQGVWQVSPPGIARAPQDRSRRMAITRAPTVESGGEFAQDEVRGSSVALA